MHRKNTGAAGAGVAHNHHVSGGAAYINEGCGLAGALKVCPCLGNDESGLATADQVFLYQAVYGGLDTFAGADSLLALGDQLAVGGVGDGVVDCVVHGYLSSLLVWS